MSADGADDIGKLVIDAQLCSGRHVRIRAVTANDGPRMRDGMARMTPQSRYFRFFSGAQELPSGVIDRLLSVDGRSHLAWGALDCDDPYAPAIAVVHAIRADPQALMEFSAVVVDEYQSEGLSKLLSMVLLAHCHALGERTLVAHVLEQNLRTKAFVDHLGGERIGAEAQVAEYRLNVAEAFASLRQQEVDGSEAVLAALAPWLPPQPSGSA